jgi:hypothetical protein
MIKLVRQPDALRFAQGLFTYLIRASGAAALLPPRHFGNWRIRYRKKTRGPQS